MQFGICPISVVPVRIQPDHVSEMSTQLLYGELFKVLVERKQWSKISIAYDGQEGWISNDQYMSISESDFKKIAHSKESQFTSDLVSHIDTNTGLLLPIVMGTDLKGLDCLNHTFEGNLSKGKKTREHLIETALLYLNTPYLWGGKTPFGIDCSGFTQMVYKINGFDLMRNAIQQSKQGIALSFIEESEPGDLAFFDNDAGIIDHVGIILKNNYIIHAHGKVRIDRLDHTGIFNSDVKRYSHKLRVIKKVI
ncbi:MAG: C40 family peptidase [Bacteroidota bacterium]